MRPEEGQTQSLHTLIGVKQAATTSVPLVFTSHFSHTLKKTGTLQHQGTSSVHAQSRPHNDGYWHPCCILKPPCTGTVGGNHSQASTACDPRSKGHSWHGDARPLSPTSCRAWSGRRIAGDREVGRVGASFFSTTRSRIRKDKQKNIKRNDKYTEKAKKTPKKLKKQRTRQNGKKGEILKTTHPSCPPSSWPCTALRRPAPSRTIESGEKEEEEVGLYCHGETRFGTTWNGDGWRRVANFAPSFGMNFVCALSPLDSFVRFIKLCGKIVRSGFMRYARAGLGSGWTLRSHVS